MAIDSAIKRRLAANIPVWRRVLPVADSTDRVEDRAIRSKRYVTANAVSSTVGGMVTPISVGRLRIVAQG